MNGLTSWFALCFLFSHIYLSLSLSPAPSVHVPVDSTLMESSTSIWFRKVWIWIQQVGHDPHSSQLQIFTGGLGSRSRINHGVPWNHRHHGYRAQRPTSPEDILFEENEGCKWLWIVPISWLALISYHNQLPPLSQLMSWMMCLLTFFVTLDKMSGNIQHDLKVVKHQDEAPPAQGHPPREAVSHKAAGTFP